MLFQLKMPIFSWNKSNLTNEFQIRFLRHFLHSKRKTCIFGFTCPLTRSMATNFIYTAKKTFLSLPLSSEFPFVYLISDLLQYPPGEVWVDIYYCRMPLNATQRRKEKNKTKIFKNFNSATFSKYNYLKSIFLFLFEELRLLLLQPFE